ncbi:hypothetical protein HYQ45_009977 [Verticillium longisporum]|uniref:Gfo/Idh/MocA-like oxidoreductase N-terminal domain-containing protein n=2 Tax=Verticillium longisporum TaxID=100787 RepID=A0A0G4LYI0_VERLO|nr:hypothetical protein HYQ44_003513 [Verticillium longisporum]KAG7131480.1 hypothetical protein HYQ45_009977 [Verticillium longisporum]CRK27054.1 hypothetical protein BN1708_004275 [Verticillium longisporum]
MIAVALLGGGIFAREQYVPAIRDSPSLTLRAVYSRSEKTAAAVSAEVEPRPDIYYDSPDKEKSSLDDLLSRADIFAVIICLPIPVQAGIVRRALAAGKHVLSEKPIARDVATASALIAWHVSRPGTPVWAVAENFRFNESLQYAADRLRDIGGRLVTFRLAFYTCIKKDNKYYQTEWRRTPDFQGGFLLDAAVHFIASLRLLLCATGDTINRVMAASALLQEHLVPVDTIHAVALTESGRSGTISLSYGIEPRSDLEIVIITTRGSVTWTPVKVQVTTVTGLVNEVKEFIYDNAVRAEIEAFCRSLPSGVPDQLQTPLEALEDLKILQALLESGELSGTPRDINS